MANINITSDAWTKISITSGTVQNISATADIELSAEQTDNSGVVLKPSELYQWDNETIYARAVTEDTGALRVVNFKKATGGGGGYVLPVASSSTLGGVKVGSNLSIDESGVLSATGGGSVDDGTPIGRVVYDAILRNGYIRANGAVNPSATTNYPLLLAFLNNNPSLLAADAAAYAANPLLFLYNENADELTVPNYVALVLQGAATLGTIAAGLPNIKGTFVSRAINSSTNYVVETDATKGAFDQTAAGNTWTNVYSQGNSVAPAYISFDASRSSAIYSDSVTTVQPPAAGTIPQIRYE